MKPIVFCVILQAGVAAAESVAVPEGHGTTAPYSAFPSHKFQLAPRWHPKPELAFHFGLLQPVFFHGFNAAVDVAWGPMLISYSHGEGLNYSATPSLGLSKEEREAGLLLESPYTTGGGVGVVILDELHVMVDFKVHRYHAAVGLDSADYTTVSIGGELGWRFFVWRGFFVQPLLRYWPNVWTSLPGGVVQLGPLRHEAKDLGFFANVSLGWAFEP
jgi:hypothetical protein